MPICNKLRKPSLNCEEDKYLRAVVMVIILQDELPARKGRYVGIHTMHLKNIKCGVPVVAQWLTNPTRNHEVAGSVPALAQ